MPKKKPGMTPEEQGRKFEEAVRELEAAGELNRTDAEKAVDRIVRHSRAKGTDSTS